MAEPCKSLVLFRLPLHMPKLCRSIWHLVQNDIIVLRPFAGKYCLQLVKSPRFPNADTMTPFQISNPCDGTSRLHPKYDSRSLSSELIVHQNQALDQPVLRAYDCHEHRAFGGQNKYHHPIKGIRDVS